MATFATGTATYTYDATGNKLRKVNLKSGVTITTDYISGIEYDNSTTTIGFIQTEEGKAVPLIGGGYDYTYYLGDNLGNTRITFNTKTCVAVTQQKDDYYPFGLEIAGTVLGPKNEYLYNKKKNRRNLTSTITAHGFMIRSSGGGRPQIQCQKNIVGGHRIIMVIITLLKTLIFTETR